MDFVFHQHHYIHTLSCFQQALEAFAESLGELAARIGEHWTPIGQHLFDAVIDGISDLYRDGRKPMPAGYFGRDEFEH